MDRRLRIGWQLQPFGCSMLLPYVSLQLHPFSLAEAKAISLALDLISKHHLQKAVICSDSLSCLLAIDSFKVKQPTILQILTQYKGLEASGAEVLFCWIPSHLGIPGNTVVDREAKKALNKPISQSKIYYKDLQPKISKYIFKSLAGCMGQRSHK